MAFYAVCALPCCDAPAEYLIKVDELLIRPRVPQPGEAKDLDYSIFANLGAYQSAAVKESMGRFQLNVAVSSAQLRSLPVHEALMSLIAAQPQPQFQFVETKITRDQRLLSEAAAAAAAAAAPMSS